MFISYFQIWSPSDRQALLRNLARLLIKSSCTKSILTYFQFLLPDLLQRAISSAEDDGFSLAEHEQLSVAFSIIAQYDVNCLR